MFLVSHICRKLGGIDPKTYPIPTKGKQGSTPIRHYRFGTAMMGFPLITGRLAIAAAQTMQRANAISPGLLWLESAMDDSALTATARWTCSESCFDPS
jgi:hypothetical protein